MAELDGLAIPGAHPLLHRAAEIEREKDAYEQALRAAREAVERVERQMAVVAWELHHESLHPGEAAEQLAAECEVAREALQVIDKAFDMDEPLHSDALERLIAAAREVAAMTPHDVYLGELRAALAVFDAGDEYD